MNTIDHTTKTSDAPRTNGSTPPTTLRSEHATGRLLRRVSAGFLAIHGFAHLVGTSGTITAIEDATSVDYLFGQWTITNTAALVGAATVWALVAVGFTAVGVATWITTARWLKALVAITSVSLVLCLVALPQAAIGAVIDIALLAIAITLLNRQPDRSIQMNDPTEQLWARLAEEWGGTDERFDPATIEDLPPPARRFLIAAIPPGTPLATGVELEMTGRIKLGIWLPFTARQILRAGVGLVWAPVVGRRLIRFVGSDSLGPDGGRMQFRLHDRITVVNAGGPDVDKSAAGRLAAETAAWLPQALTPQAGATWKPINDSSATVVLPGPDGPIDIDLTIDANGRLTDIDLMRWNGSRKPPAHERFGGPVTGGYQTDGVRLAGSGSVGWARGTPDQDDGVFFYYRLTAARFLHSSAGDMDPNTTRSITPWSAEVDSRGPATFQRSRSE